MNRKALAVTLVAALTLGALVISGCHDNTKDFNTYVGQASKHVENFSSMETSIQTAVSSLNAIAMNPKGAKKALLVTKSIRDQLAAETAELEAASAITAKAKALDVTPEMKKYADLETNYFRALIAITAEKVKFYNAMDVTYKAIRDKTGITKEIEKSQAAVNSLEASVQDLTQKAAAAQKAAADYFKANVASK